jgi:signal transduction histidine kinase
MVMSKLESAGILAGGLAHDFNNLLASLLLNLEMLGLSGPVNTEQTKFLQQARGTIKTAKALTEQLITFAGGDDSTRRPVDLRGLVRQSVELALLGSEIETNCEISPELWPASVNETQITQVLRGLILNAREATPAGGHVRVSAENVVLEAASPAELPPGHYVRISIADDGAGIPAGVLPNIFDPYFSTKDRGSQKGMGLGLSICRTVIKRHGGAIAIDSQPGRGTTVICHLPAVAPRPPLA